MRKIVPAVLNLRKIVSPHALTYLVQQIVSVFSLLVCLRWISVTDAGLWQTITLVESYLLFLRFGVLNAFNREYPFTLGRGDTKKAIGYLNATECFILGLSGILCLIILCSLFFYRPNTIKNWWMIVATMAVYVPLNLYRNFLDLTYRTSQEFAKLSKIQFLLIITSLLSILLVYFYQFEGFLVRQLAMSATAILLYSLYRTQRFNPKYNLPDIKYLFRQGLPLFGSNYLNAVIISFPKIQILRFADLATLGLFTPVLSVINFGGLVPATISTYMLPKLNFDYGRSGKKDDVIKGTFKAAAVSLLVMLPISLMGWFLLPVLVEKLLPNYISSIQAIQIAMVLCLATSFKLLYNTFTVLKAWPQLYVYLLANLAFGWFVPNFFLQTDWLGNKLLTLVTSMIVVELLMLFVSAALQFRLYSLSNEK